MKLQSKAMPSSEGFKQNTKAHLSALAEISEAAEAARLGGGEKSRARHESRGKMLPRDAVVLGLLGAANHDPDVFESPERFDIERRMRGEPKHLEHLAFGGGVHFCLGAHLARLEAQIAIGSLVARFDELALVSDGVEWGPSFFRVPGQLAITFRDNPR